MTRRSATPFRMLVALAFSMAFVYAAPGFAQTSDEDARRHFEAGEAYFKTSDYDGALREFNQAYQLAEPAKRPAILLSVASVHERMGNLPKTVETLEKWLAEAPVDHRERATVELRIQNLKRRIAEQPAPAASSSTTAAPASPTTTTSSAPLPPAPAPEPNRMPAYLSWGVGGAAAVGAVVTGLLAKSKYDDADSGCAKTPEGCSDSEVSAIKSMALVSTILTGVAVVGGGLGTYLYLSADSPSQERASGVVPRIRAGMTHRGGGFEATWRF